MLQNWDDLRLFLTVAREHSLSGAGKVLRLDPATLSRRIARLEGALNAALFVKSPQGYALTEAGLRLFEQAKAAERALRGVSVEPGEGGARLTGQVRIGAPDGCANFLLPQVCADIGAAHPDLDIQIVALPRVFNLSRREADMAIGVSAPTAGRLVVQKITEYHLHLAASQAYLATIDPITSRADLRGKRVIGYIPDMIFDRELDYLADLGVDRVPLASNSVAVQARMIQNGGGLGVVHDFSLPFIPGVRRVLAHEIQLKRAFYLIRHADEQRNPVLQGFADLLRNALRSEVARLEAKA